jgi:hypothetical protein
LISNFCERKPGRRPIQAAKKLPRSAGEFFLSGENARISGIKEPFPLDRDDYVLLDLGAGIQRQLDKNRFFNFTKGRILKFDY